MSCTVSGHWPIASRTTPSTKRPSGSFGATFCSSRACSKASISRLALSSATVSWRRAVEVLRRGLHLGAKLLQLRRDFRA